jgi:signal transduction histidine kinase/CheY-like chemotaxis protein
MAIKLTTLPPHYRHVLNYIYALVGIVALAAAALLTAAYIVEQTDDRTRTRIYEFHLHSLGHTARLLEAVNALSQHSDVIPEVSSTNPGSPGLLPIRAEFIDIPYTIHRELQLALKLQQGQEGAELFARALDRAIQRSDNLRQSISRGELWEVSSTEREMLSLRIQQLDRLHSVALERLLRALDERAARQASFLGGLTLLTLFLAGLLTWWILALFRSALIRQIDTEGELSESRQRLEHVQKLDALGRLVGGVAHDFNNLLTAILQQVELLLSGPKDREHYQAGLHEIQAAGEQAASLTQQLLTFSRRQPVERQVVDLNLLIENVEPMLRRLIGEKILLAVDYEPDLAPAELDPGQIDQLLLNLVVNARDAMPRGGVLTIRTCNLDNVNGDPKFPGMPVGSYCGILVEDSGLGMDRETLSRLFEPFFTTKEKGRGTGLGLSTVHGIVTGSNGHIFVDSEPGQGSRFEIYFPQCITPTESILPQAVAESQSVVHGSETVLVIEDEEPIRKILSAGLAQLGYQVLTAGNGTEALAICSEEPDSIDVIVADVVMPDMNGPEVVQRALEFQGTALVIYMSGYTDDIVLKSGVSTTEIALLNKPFKLAELARLMRVSLDARNEESSQQSA